MKRNKQSLRGYRRIYRGSWRYGENNHFK